MRAGLPGISAIAFVAALPCVLAGQQLPPPPHGPAALSVPHPIPPISTSPGPPPDLYQQLTPPPRAPRTIFYSPGFVYGPYASYGPYGSSMYMGSSYPTGGESLVRQGTAPRIARGGLRFESSPGSAQIYVDGLYVGVIDDFGISGRALDLEEGTHRVELRASGYATLSFDITIAANETMRYRGDLQRPSPPPASSSLAPAPIAPKSTYVIPNCYAGDRPPSRALPRGCDLSKMLVRKP